jgi:predicted acetyltransferase
MMVKGHIEVTVATQDEEPVLANLLELYTYDFSEFHDLALGVDGRFGYRNLPLYWREPNRRPFLIRMDGKFAGLVLVKRGSEISGDETIWDMAEFFVVRAYRRLGVGAYAAQEVWRRIPGAWEVRVMESNHPALRFWERTISAFTGGVGSSTRIEKGCTRWRVYSFDSNRLP